MKHGRAEILSVSDQSLASLSRLCRIGTIILTMKHTSARLRISVVPSTMLIAEDTYIIRLIFL